MTEKEALPNPGIYEHYKSTPEQRRYYEVTGFARHTETGEPLVLYTPLYTEPSHTDDLLPARPLRIFMQDVEVDGVTVPRFRYVGPPL